MNPAETEVNEAMFIAHFGPEKGRKVLASVIQGRPVRIGGECFIRVNNRLEPLSTLSTVQKRNAMVRCAASDLAGLCNHGGLVVDNPRHWLFVQSAVMSIASISTMPEGVLEGVFPTWAEEMASLD